MKITPTQAQQRHDAIEVLRNQLRPQKTYEVMKPTAQSVNIIDGTMNGHGVKFVFYYQPSKADMANAHHATKLLEINLRDGVKHRKAHLAQLVENDITEYTDILTINSKDLENPIDQEILNNQESEGTHERE
jgi:hypothetical protein